MTREGKAAFITAQAACAQVEAYAMLAANQADLHAGRPPTYGFHDLLQLQNKYCIGHNAVISFMDGL